VTTTADEALELGRGVCQDFSHIMLAACRSQGLPARCVSGYLLQQRPGRRLACLGGCAHRRARVAVTRSHARLRAEQRVCARHHRPRLRRCAAHARGFQGERKRDDGCEGDDHEDVSRAFIAHRLNRERSTIQLGNPNGLGVSRRDGPRPPG
jgi:hypothetical protein